MVQAVRHEMTLRTVKSYKFHKQVFDSKVRIRCNDCVLHGGRGIQVGIPLAWDREVVGVVEEEGAILGAERDSNLQQNYALTKDLQSQYPVRRVGDVASCKLCLLTFDHERSKSLQHKSCSHIDIIEQRLHAIRKCTVRNDVIQVDR